MGISGFFNILNTKYNKPKSITDTISKKYDFILLDYQSLFYNFNYLYEEINYLIRWLYNFKNDIVKYSHPFYNVDMNGNVVYTKKYHIVNYILEHFDLFFSNLGITSNCYPKYDKSYDNAKLSEIQFSTIDNILALFRNPDINKIYSDTIVEEMVNHTKSFTKYLKVKNNQNIGVYFDSMPSIAKIKEQVSRRVAIDSYIIKDIIEKGDGLEKEIRQAQIKTSMDISVGSDITTRTYQRLLSEGFNVKNPIKIYGEAEHNIMKDIDMICTKHKDNVNILLSSPDADLIILSIIQITKYSQLTLDIYRETREEDYKFSYKYEINLPKVASSKHPSLKTVDVSKKPNTIVVNSIKGSQSGISPWKTIISFINTKQLKTTLGLNTSQMTYDIAFLFLLLGDDFLPKIPTVYNNDAIGDIIDIYNQLLKNKSFKIINMLNKTIIYDNFILFLNEFKNYESKYLKSVNKKLNDKVNSKLRPLKKSIYSNKQLIDDFYGIDMNTNMIYRKIHAFNEGVYINDDGSEKVLLKKSSPIAPSSLDMIKTYLEGTKFICDLYLFNTMKNYKWIYKYERTPTVNEIVKFLNDEKVKPNVDFDAIFDYSYGQNGIQQYFNLEKYKQFSSDNILKIKYNIYKKIMGIDNCGCMSGTCKCKNIDSPTCECEYKEHCKCPNPKCDEECYVKLTDDQFKNVFTYANVKKIYNCENTLYLKNCISQGEDFIIPEPVKYFVDLDMTLLGGGDYYNKYLKYKNKYLSLKKNK